MIWKTMPPVLLADGSAEALKWLALVLMTLDHVNKYIYDGSLSWIFEIARISFPLFGFVLAYNLARPEAIGNGAPKRMMKRLLTFSLMASLPHVALDARFFPMNILATLLVSTSTIYLFEQAGFKKWYGCIVFMLGGYIVEGNWFAIAVCVTAYYYCKSTTALRLLSVIVSLVVLGLFVNLNQWALAVLPIILIAQHFNLKINRHKNLFYWFYPAHLALIALAKTGVYPYGWIKAVSGRYQG
jgi:hypothetical protein